MTTRRAKFRVHARKSVRLRALATHIEAGWQRHVDVIDLGLGGAGIVVDEPLDVGDLVSLSFVAPTLFEPLVLRAKVAWLGSVDARGRARAGVAFEHKTPEAALALFELVSTST